MKKDAFYFPHFCNARHDRKLKRIRKELGIEGYGIYFMILEVLREQPDYKYPVSDLDLLADEFGTSEAKVKTIIANYDLFFVDENQLFFSVKMIEYLVPYNKMKEQRKNAVETRWRKFKKMQSSENEANHDTTVLRPNNDRNTTVIQRKEKESKVKEIKESKGNKSKVNTGVVLPFDSKNFLEMWNVLKSEPKWKNKSKNALQAALKKLAKHTEADAIEMMENAIAGGWQGIFELDKKNKNEKRNDLADFGKAVNEAAADIFRI